MFHQPVPETPVAGVHFYCPLLFPEKCLHRLWHGHLMAAEFFHGFGKFYRMGGFEKKALISRVSF